MDCLFERGVQQLFSASWKTVPDQLPAMRGPREPGPRAIDLVCQMEMVTQYLPGELCRWAEVGWGSGRICLASPGAQ